MIDVAASVRRIALALGAIAIAGALCHREISTMLVERGDAALIAHGGDANALYRRALWFDRSNAVAADRLIFAAILSHDPHAIRRAIGIANSFLGRVPGAAEIRLDRALCFQLLRRYGEAAVDFERIGRARRDARALLFAADDQSRLRNTPRAIALLREAHRDEPGFKPVRRALERLAFQ